MTRYRGGRPGEPIAGRTVIVVDDGLATGDAVAEYVLSHTALPICAVDGGDDDEEED